MTKTDKALVLDLLARIPIEEILELATSTAIFHAHNLNVTQPDNTAGAETISRAFERARVLGNALAYVQQR